MNSQIILYPKGNNDECMTPAYAVQALLPFLPKDKIIWCPFDTENSNFVKVLTANDYQIEYSHIANGQDFYSYQPERWDIMASNPPFTGKRHIFERALSLGKPFALLMSLTWLNDSAPKDLFKDKELQLLMFRDRIKYLKPDGTLIDNKITFASAYFCHGILPKQILII